MHERIVQIADGLLSLKEIEYQHRSQSADLATRISTLALSVLGEVEQTVGIVEGKGIIPERVKEVRKRLIELEGQSQPGIDYAKEMQKMFFVTQLYSYPGDYVLRKPSIERIAETVDKFEEDVLGAAYPSVHGPKRVVVQFGTRIELPKGKGRTMSAGDLTERMQSEVQSMLDSLNEQHDSNLGE